MASKYTVSHSVLSTRPYMSSQAFNMALSYMEQGEGELNDEGNEIFFDEMDSSEIKELLNEYNSFSKNSDKFMDSTSDEDDIEEVLDELHMTDPIINGATLELERRNNVVVNGNPYDNNYDREVNRHISSMNQSDLQ